MIISRNIMIFLVFFIYIFSVTLYRQEKIFVVTFQCGKVLVSFQCKKSDDNFRIVPEDRKPWIHWTLVLKTDLFLENLLYIGKQTNYQKQFLWNYSKVPPPQGQGRFIKIADPSVCPTRGDSTPVLGGDFPVEKCKI